MLKLIIPLTFLTTLACSDFMECWHEEWKKPEHPYCDAQGKGVNDYGGDLGKNLLFVGTISGFVPAVIAASIGCAIFTIIRRIVLKSPKPPKSTITSQNYHKTLIETLEDDS